MNGQLVGDLSYRGNLSAIDLIGKLSSSLNIESKLNVSSINPPYYEGEYEITPKVDAQTLTTKDKLMADDLTVNRIPYYETSNEYGYTAYIGSEVEINGN